MEGLRCSQVRTSLPRRRGKRSPSLHDPHQLPRLARRTRSTPIDMSAHRPPRGNNMQTSLMRARRSPHGRSAARKQNTKQALCHWKTRLESRCFRAWRTYYTVQTSRRRVFWNHVAIVRGKLAVRCRCFRRWARLPAFVKARKAKMRMAYRHAYLRTVKLMFTQWVEYCSQPKPAPNEAGNRAMPQVASELSPEAKNLAAKAMLGRALVKLRRYTTPCCSRGEIPARAKAMVHVPF